MGLGFRVEGLGRLLLNSKSSTKSSTSLKVGYWGTKVRAEFVALPCWPAAFPETPKEPTFLGLLLMISFYDSLKKVGSLGSRYGLSRIPWFRV